MELTNQIISTGVELICLVIILLLTKYVKPIFVNTVGKDKLSQIKEWMMIFVKAAEQVLGAGTGEEKKKMVMDYITAKAQELDIDISDIDIDAILEAAVYNLSNNEEE